METLTGRVKNTVYRNPENGYQIARITTDDGSTETVTGYFPVFATDTDYQFEGSWVTHPTYGRQFKVETFKKMTTQSENGVVSYLSSSLFTGIGPKTAQRIVDVLGLDAIARILEDKTVLTSVSGFSAVKAARLYQELVDHQANEHILVSLYAHDISGRLAMKLIERYGMSTLETLEENPYRLIEDIEGIGFLKADAIAMKLGFSEDDPRRTKAALIHTVTTMTYSNGDTVFSKEDIVRMVKDLTRIDRDLDDTLETLVSEGRLILEGDMYYLDIVYQAESMLAESIRRIMTAEEDLVDKDHVMTALDAFELRGGITYTDIQRTAILTAIRSPMTVITGGPGTGKTTIIQGLLEVYRTVLRKGPKTLKESVGLMAPTGRAAKRMKEILGLDAKTIHRHLGFTFEGFFSHDAADPLPFDMIVVDEASMIDLFLARRLFDAVMTGTKVVIVGDVDQLPSVGPGMVLSDLIASDVVPVVRLTEIHRQAKESHIISLARAVNAQIVTQDDLVSSSDVYFYKCHPDRIKDVLSSQIQGAVKRGFSLSEDIQVLAPMYRGDLGIDALNSHLKDVFNPGTGPDMTYGDKRFHRGDKVIQLQNDIEKNVMNGDIGVVRTIGEDAEGTAYMSVDYDDNTVVYHKADLENVALAYAVSIHKAQGSEYRIVMMPMVRGYQHMLRKELIYTAITRSREILVILGDIRLLPYAANRIYERRKTTLASRISGTAVEDDPTAGLSPYDFMD